jgi:hypothetical protein
MLETQVQKLCRESHEYENLGVEYWMQQIDEEMFALEDMQSQIFALRGQVLENVRNDRLISSSYGPADITSSVRQYEPFSLYPGKNLSFT